MLLTTPPHLQLGMKAANKPLEQGTDRIEFTILTTSRFCHKHPNYPNHKLG
jgi:hypothetical protein